MNPDHNGQLGRLGSRRRRRRRRHRHHRTPMEFTLLRSSVARQVTTKHWVASKGRRVKGGGQVL